MTQVTIVPATLEAAFVLSTTMRPDDVQELDACGYSPLDGVLKALERSELAGAALYDDVVGAMFGVAHPMAPGMPHQLWLLTSHLFGQKPIAFARASRRVLAQLRAAYPSLSNVIDARYVAAQRFAQALGAEFSEMVLVKGAPFVPFTFAPNNGRA